MRSGLLSSSSLLSNYVPAVHNSMAIVDQTSSFLGSLGKLNYIKYYSLSISKVYSMWTLLTTSLLPPLWKPMTLKWYVAKLLTLWQSNSNLVCGVKILEKKLIFVKPFTCPAPNMMSKRRVFVLFRLLKNLHVRRTFLPSWGSQDRDSSKNINSLSFSIKSMLENREPLFFTESRQYIRSAPWNRVFAQDGFEIYTDV